MADEVTLVADTRLKPGDGIVIGDSPLTILENQENLVPPLKEFERLAVKESIQQIGVQIPVIISLKPTRGRIIDGYNRWEICKELGMSCPVTFKEYESVEAEDKAALALNVQRRQLDDLSAGMINIKLLEMNGIVGRGHKSLTGLKISDVSREAGQTERTFYRRIELARLLTRPDCTDVMTAYRNEELTNQEALTLCRARKKAADGGGSPPQPRKGQTLREMVNDLKKGTQISPLEQARMEAFSEGLKWGWEAGNEKPADPDWVLEQLQNWRQSVLDREQQARDAKKAAKDAPIVPDEPAAT